VTGRFVALEVGHADLVETDDGDRRALTEELFASMTVEGRRVSVIEPRDIDAPLFKIDRENRPDRW
jgi:hypothetical protein